MRRSERGSLAKPGSLPRTRLEGPAPISRRGFLGAGLAAGAAGSSLTACDTTDGEGVGHRSVAALKAPQGPQDPAWAAVREHFVLEAGTAYMNNASLGMPPVSVANAVRDGFLALSQEPLRGKNGLSATIADRVVPGLAALLGSNPDEIVLTRNASEALHMAAAGTGLRPGDEVLITSQEHPAGRRPWELRAVRDGVKVNTVFIPSPFESGEQVVGLVGEALTPRTRALAFCHVTRGGHLYPVAELCALARERGIVSHVDGAQAVGMFPVDLHALGCDTYSASLHKWLLGPSGTDVFFVRAAARERVLSAFAHDSVSDAPAYQPPGTQSLPVQAALAAALELAEAVGLEAVAARNRFLSDFLKDRLARLDGVTLSSGPTAETACPGSTIFEFRGLDAVEAVPLIAERARVHIDEHQRDGHDAIRVSTHFYNTTAEIDRLIAVLDDR